MDKEILYIIIPPLFWFLWTSGGKWNKAFRRLGIPLLILTVCLLQQVSIYSTIAVAGLSAASYAIGYGNTKSWLFRVFVGFCYALALLPLGYSPILLAIPAVFVVTFWASRKGWLTWKIAEGLTSLTISISFVFILTK